MSSPFKATISGMLLPICSCGVGAPFCPGGAYQDIFLSQKNRSEGMQYFDFVMSEE
jgi:hypothetical protein